MRLPRLVIDGASVRDYAYQWINGGCLLHQWCSGARGIDRQVVEYVNTLRSPLIARINAGRASAEDAVDCHNLFTLRDYLEENIGHPAERYIPDEWVYALVG